MIFIKIPGNNIEQCRLAVQMEREKESSRGNGTGNGNKWFLNNVLRFLQACKERIEQEQITGATLRNYEVHQVIL